MQKTHYMQVNIVVLDGYTLNPGDLSWHALQQLGNVTVYDRSNADEVELRSRNAHIILTNKAIVNAQAINNSPHLQYIGVTATGYNIVDVAAAAAKNIVVTNVPAYSTHSVAQTTFALLLELTHAVGTHNLAVKNGDWSNNKDFSFALQPLTELAGKTIGIVGFGAIGKAVAAIALAMQMQVIAVHKHPERDAMQGVSFVSLEECFMRSDVVTLHVPLNANNNAFVNSFLLQKMKPTAYLINTSRGGLLNEADVAFALNNNIIAGAGLDVLSTEPPLPNNPLLTAKNCIITPHIAWASKEARQRLMQKVVENVACFLQGQPQNVVSV